MAKPKDNAAEKELNRLEGEFNAFKENLDKITKDEADKAPVLETEAQTKLSSREVKALPDHYLKPEKFIACRNKFNEKFRDEYNFKKEYVNFIAENKEIPGETIETWTKGWPGVPAEFWKVPVNKPVWGPRYLAEQITRAKYHIFKMQDAVYETGSRGGADLQYHGSMAVKSTVNRLDAYPVGSGRSNF